MVFPVAGVEIHPVVPPLLGLTIGVLSGLFGIGGGFLLTPVLVWTGVPPHVAVGTCLNQMVAASSSGALLNARLGNVHARMGALVAAGGLAGGVAGTLLVGRLLEGGSFGPSLGVAYVIVLIAMGGGMLRESRRSRGKCGETSGEGTLEPTTRAYAAAFGLGLGVGMISSFLGGGGGVVLVPALIYALGVSTRVAVGTSLFALLCVSVANTVFHASVNHSVDVVLAALLMLGSVPGSCLGVWLGRKLKARSLRGLFGGVLLLAGTKMLWDVLKGNIGGGASPPRTDGTAFEAVGRFASEHGVVYGIAAAAFAVVVGGTVGTLFRKRVCGEPRPASAEPASQCAPQTAAPDAPPEAAEE